MEKIEKTMDREIAWRIFAHEFNMSNLFISEDDDRAPNYIITPTGVKCNRLFIIGVVTEVENIGKDNNLWRARIADPTGVFTIYAGQYQPEAAIFLSELQVPSYVAIAGKARKYEPEDGAVYLSVRPEEINISDEKQRDRWILEAAERTLERINIMNDALNSGLSGNELQEFLLKKGTNNVNGVMHAIKHYENLEKILLEIKKALAHAIETVTLDSGIMISPQEQIKVQEIPGTNIDEFKTHERSFEKMKGNEPKEILASIIDELDTGKGASFSDVNEIAHKAGLDARTVELSLKELMDEGRCYEPKIGVLRKV